MSAFKTSNVRITGYPRNDLLCNKETNNTFTITYLPTFRDSIGYKIDLFSDFNFNLELWDKSLSKSSIKLNIKMHPLSKPTDELLTKFNVLENINFLDEIDVAEILPKTDILITDYSSVYFDYLLRDKPIIFAPFDYDNYITKDREFYYNYNEVTPGPKCKDWNEVLEWIEKFKKDPTIYADERQKVRDRFHKYQDGENCERVYNEIIKL
jgi:CDP-glycerol glycerophosphotransferase (TagB/SpsB family)